MGWIRWAAIAIFAVGATAHAADEGDLSARSRAIAPAKAAEVQAQSAPFTVHGDAMRAAMVPPEALPGNRSVPCVDGLSTLCYDMRDRGVVYRGARNYLPRVEGLTPEGVAIRRDRIILRYSFK